MNVTQILTRSSLAVALLALAACQSTALQQETATQPTQPAVAASTAPVPTEAETVQPAAEQGALVAVFLADMVAQEGWREVPVGSNATLYLDPTPLITREDLTGVQAGSNPEGLGLLALMLSEEASARVAALTEQHPNKRLALVVGRTLMAAPGYSEPVTSGQLIFPVGSEGNATAAARAIAGVDESASPQ